MFHRHWRALALEALDQPFDVVVVGGGITGCGIFFDAALRGLRVLLLEKGDLASGTSSRSSKLIHGGLRYLKNMQWKVTRQSCRERDLQLALAPHLVSPIEWIYPAYRGDRTAGWKVELGLWIYDRMTTQAVKHRRISTDEAERLAPGLEHSDLDRALAYYDARVDDARLTTGVAATGFAHGGWLLTRAEVLEARRGPRGRVRGVAVRDLESGAVHEVEASLVVNATGAWVDTLRHRMGCEGQTVRPSRGSHLLFDTERLPLQAAVSISSPDDGRPVFFIPHAEGVLLGTTDLFHDGSLDDPRPTDAEVGYLLRAAAIAFPHHHLGRDDVRGAFAGVRPVLDHGAVDPSAASREEAIWHEEGLLSVAGGKLTTWRATAEQAVDVALQHLPDATSRRARACTTQGTPLAGLAPADLPRRLSAAFDIDQAVADGMARRLGATAWAAAEMAGPGDLKPLRDDLDVSVAELVAHARFGAVVHLSDLLLRRVRVGMWRPDVAADIARSVARRLAPELGWDVDAELEHFAHDLEAWTLAGVIDEVAS